VNFKNEKDFDYSSPFVVLLGFMGGGSGVEIMGEIILTNDGLSFKKK